jgi:hypothetical protein
MAGMCKSTISRTVAQTFTDRGQLGAIFFFKRGEHDRANANQVFTTIAHDLVCQIPALLPHAHKAINNDPGIARKTLKEQFEKLIFQPLTDIGPTAASSSIFVIDALDECEREGDVSAILVDWSQHAVVQLYVVQQTDGPGHTRALRDIDIGSLYRVAKLCRQSHGVIHSCFSCIGDASLYQKPAPVARWRHFPP